jgi:hypothetical protein
MKIRTCFAAICFGVAFAATSMNATALELREPKSHMIVDVPNSWTVGTEGQYVVAAPQDQTFHLRLIGTDHGQYTKDAATSTALSFINIHFNNVQMSGQAQYVNWGNYTGFELFGTGNEKNAWNTPGKFFVSVLTDKMNPRKGLVVIGTGTIAGFDMHQGEIHRALQSIRTY